MKKKIFLGALIALFSYIVPFSVQAQRSEFGAMVGTTFYLGELNQTKLFSNPHLAAGFMYRYNLSPRWGLKADFIFGKVSASDQGTSMQARGLSFSSPITEFSMEAELNFLKLYNSTGKNRFAPYIFAGLTIFSYNPQAELNGTVYDLQSLGTEGQGLDGQKKRYSLTNAAIPFGIGIKVTAGRYFAFGAEWGMRYTFTDHLDDVGGLYYDNMDLQHARGDIVAQLADPSNPKHQAGEQRGNTTTTDLYSFAGVNITVKFGNEDKTCDLRKSRRK